jgi:hypothetical protein
MAKVTVQGHSGLASASSRRTQRPSRIWTTVIHSTEIQSTKRSSIKKVQLAKGSYSLHVRYFRGMKFKRSQQLLVTPPDEPEKLFDPPR